MSRCLLESIERFQYCNVIAQQLKFCSNSTVQCSVSERAASPGKGLFKGSGVLPQQAKTGFRRQRWKSVLSVCGNKRPACKVAHLWITRQLKSTVQNEQLMEIHTLQAMSLWVQRPETASPGAAGNRCFRLLGGFPNPLNRPLRWSGCAAILPLLATVRC